MESFKNLPPANPETPACSQTPVIKKKSYKREQRPPATAYEKVARQPNNVFTAGVLSDRSRISRAITDLEG